MKLKEDECFMNSCPRHDCPNLHSYLEGETCSKIMLKLSLYVNSNFTLSCFNFLHYLNFYYDFCIANNHCQLDHFNFDYHSSCHTNIYFCSSSYFPFLKSGFISQEKELGKFLTLPFDVEDHSTIKDAYCYL